MYHHQIGINADKRVAPHTFTAADTLQQKTVWLQCRLAISRDRSIHIGKNVTAKRQKRSARAAFCVPQMLNLLKCWIVHSCSYLCMIVLLFARHDSSTEYSIQHYS